MYGAVPSLCRDTVLTHLVTFLMDFIIWKDEYKKGDAGWNYYSDAWNYLDQKQEL